MTQARPGVQGARGPTGPAGPRGGRSAVVGFLILMTFAFFGFVAVDREAGRAKVADRESCERVNVIRDIQARVLADQIEASDRTLRRNLGALEPFRREIQRSQRLRARAMALLRRSVLDYPVPHRPFAIDCAKAYP